jgi:hypothetical protein
MVRRRDEWVVSEERGMDGWMDGWMAASRFHVGSRGLWVAQGLRWEDVAK